MNFFDLLFTIVLIIILIFALKNGAIKELISSLGIVGGYFFAENYYLEYTSITAKYISPSELAESVAYGGMFIASVFAAFILSIFVSLFIRSSRTSGVSRLFGLIFGAIKGVTICLLIVVIVNQFIPSFVDDLENSRFTPRLLQLREYVSGLNIA